MKADLISRYIIWQWVKEKWKTYTKSRRLSVSGMLPSSIPLWVTEAQFRWENLESQYSTYIIGIWVYIHKFVLVID